MRYLLISNLYNEEKNVEGLFDSVESQERAPALWLIIDDGSTDGTYGLLARRTERSDLNVKIWRGPRKKESDYDTIGVSVRRALESLDMDTYHSFDYYCVLDADSRVDPGYFSELLKKMEDDPCLGMASGTVYAAGVAEATRGDLARGSGRATKAAIWRSVGRGQLPDVVSDAFFNAKTKMLGYSSVMFEDLKVRQMRPTTQRTRAGQRRKGRLMAMFWYNPLVLLGHLVVSLLHIENPLPLLLGYLEGLRGKRIGDPEVREYFSRRMLRDLIRKRFGG